MTIQQATLEYEGWLGRHLALLPDDLARKHEQMSQEAFSFLRATFYRWAQLWRLSARCSTRRAAALGGRSACRELRHLA